jgi:hypothetical protein
MVGLHCITLSVRQAENKACCKGKSWSKMKIPRTVTNFG